MAADEPSVPPKPRFGWPMRLFLGLLVFDMVFRSLSALVPYKDWCKDLQIARAPQALPAPRERQELRQRAQEGPDPVVERVWESADDVWRFWKPWPGPNTRPHLKTATDHGKFVFCWVATRLGFLGSLLRVPHRWTMVSPNVYQAEECVGPHPRHADGSTETISNVSEPASPVRYDSFRFLTEKRLQYLTRTLDDDEARLGYCNLLAHAHPVNEQASPLVTIWLVKVRY